MIFVIIEGLIFTPHPASRKHGPACCGAVIAIS
jgi:hypothetical protein